MSRGVEAEATPYERLREEGGEENAATVRSSSSSSRSTMGTCAAAAMGGGLWAGGRLLCASVEERRQIGGPARPIFCLHARATGPQPTGRARCWLGLHFFWDKFGLTPCRRVRAVTEASRL